MKKTDIVKALELCAIGGFDTCKGCPYNGMDFCDKKMCEDALALLNEKEPKATPKYTTVPIFTKKGNLVDFLNTNKVMGHFSNNEATRKYYEAEREIQLILLSRTEGNRVFCKIKCPVNPLPVKGEFEVPYFSVIQNWLASNGWHKKQTIYSSMFN